MLLKDGGQFCQYPFQIRWVAGDGGGPAPEAAVGVDRLDPFGEESALGLVLRGVLALHFEHQHRAVRQSVQEIGA